MDMRRGLEGGMIAEGPFFSVDVCLARHGMAWQGKAMGGVIAARGKSGIQQKMRSGNKADEIGTIRTA